MTQTTSVDSGHATLLKRGDAAPNANFFSGAWTVIIRHRMTDWTSVPTSGYGNIFEGNCSPADEGSTQGGLFQIYYEAVANEIRLYIGEAWTTSDTLIRGGSHTGWATYAFHCAGSTSDPVKFSYVFDDESSVTTATIGSTNGGQLRQMLAIGGIGGEEPYNTRNAQFIVYKRQLTDAEILSQRAQDTPIYTGSSNIFFYQSLSSATNCEQDEGPDNNDFQIFSPSEATTVSDVPAVWSSTISGTLTSTLGALTMAGYGGAPLTKAIGSKLITFGSRSDRATVRVSDQPGILSTSKVEAWIMADSTSDHSADEHRLLASRPRTRPIVSGVAANDGFDITIQSDSTESGEYKLRWAWVNP